MKIHIRKCDDWIAVYEDGVMQMQGHSLEFEDGLNLLAEYIDDLEITREYLEGDVDFPNVLKE